MWARTARSSRRLTSATRTTPLLSKLRLAEDAAVWQNAGFAVENGCTNIGGVAVELVGRKGGRHSWEFRDRGFVDASAATSFSMDGIDTKVSHFDVMRQSLEGTGDSLHTNGAVGLYSVLVTAGNMERAVAALGASEGILGPPVRIVEPSPFSSKLAMAFFKAGSPTGNIIVEVLAPRTPGAVVTIPGLPPIGGDDAPATIAGMVVLVPSLEVIVSLLGSEVVMKARGAVQGQGRMLAPVRHEKLGLASLTMAFMTPPDREALQAKALSGGKGLSAHLGIADISA